MRRQTSNRRPVNLHLRSNAKKSREISVNNVIKDLIGLFEYLGIDSGHLSDRVKHVDKNVIRHQPLYTHASAIGELLSLWHQDPRNLNKNGKPAPLKMTGIRRSFNRLANDSVPNLGAKQLLFELERVGAVTVDKKGYINAQMRSLPVYQNRRLAVQHTLASLKGFIRTLHHNLESAPSNSEQLFHRIAWNREFDIKEIPRLKIWVKKQGQSFLESSDNWMMRRSKLAGVGTLRQSKLVQVSVGVYLAIDAC